MTICAASAVSDPLWSAAAELAAEVVRGASLYALEGSSYGVVDRQSNASAILGRQLDHRDM